MEKKASEASLSIISNMKDGLVNFNINYRSGALLIL